MDDVLFGCGGQYMYQHTSKLLCSVQDRFVLLWVHRLTEN
jgi:hypothetical protein